MRNVLFLALVAVGVTLYGESVAELALLSLRSELHQHIPLIPLVSGYFLFLHRREIFQVGDCRQAGARGQPQGVAPTDLAATPVGATPRGCPRLQSARAGLMVLAVGAMVWGTEGFFSGGLDWNDRLSAMMTGLLLWTIGSFVLAYGVQALRAGLFPMLFLAFIVPVPGFLLDPCVTFLQAASAEAADLVFRATGVPFLREGTIFSLPGIDVEVARQCSGIRSSLALVITAVLAGNLFLHHAAGKVSLVLAVIPITVFKNALRIVTLSILGSYVDPVFITGHWLHRSGGIPFFVAGLALLSPVLWGLRRIERRADPKGAHGPRIGAFQEPRT